MVKAPVHESNWGSEPQLSLISHLEIGVVEVGTNLATYICELNVTVDYTCALRNIQAWCPQQWWMDL